MEASRLREIEDAARLWRHKATQAAAELHFISPTAFDLVAVILGPVTLGPNLTQNGLRLAGLLDVRTALPTVWCEQYDPLPRQYFSAAHELGHYALHVSQPAPWQLGCAQATVDKEAAEDNDAVASRELEAEAFAGAFLIPAAELRTAIDTYGWCAPFLAQQFAVSQAAVRRRRRQLAALEPDGWA